MDVSSVNAPEVFRSADSDSDNGDSDDDGARFPLRPLTVAPRATTTETWMTWRCLNWNTSWPSSGESMWGATSEEARLLKTSCGRLCLIEVIHSKIPDSPKEESLSHCQTTVKFDFLSTELVVDDQTFRTLWQQHGTRNGIDYDEYTAVLTKLLILRGDDTDTESLLVFRYYVTEIKIQIKKININVSVISR